MKSLQSKQRSRTFGPKRRGRPRKQRPLLNRPSGPPIPPRHHSSVGGTRPNGRPPQAAETSAQRSGDMERLAFRRPAGSMRHPSACRQHEHDGVVHLLGSVKETAHSPTHSCAEIYIWCRGDEGMNVSHRCVKLTVVVIRTGTAWPLIIVGWNRHSRTALNAASSSSGIERTTFASVTNPLSLTTTSTITVP
jgi:hypothetical protein